MTEGTLKAKPDKVVFRPGVVTFDGRSELSEDIEGREGYALFAVKGFYVSAIVHKDGWCYFEVHSCEEEMFSHRTRIARTVFNPETKRLMNKTLRLCEVCGEDMYRRKVWEKYKKKVICIDCSIDYTFDANGVVKEKEQP